MSSKAQRNRGWLLPDDITGHPTVCVQFQIPNDPHFIAATKGAINELSKWWNWEKDQTTRASQAATVFRQLIHDTLTIDDECAGPSGGSGCVEHTPKSPLIKWLPNDPFRTPPGVEFPPYPDPPWYIVPQNLPGGITAGDVLCDFSTLSPNGIDQWLNLFLNLANLPGFLASAGFPRFEFTTIGTGVIEIHFVQVFQGGIALILRDNQLFDFNLVGTSALSIGDVATLRAFIGLVGNTFLGSVNITPTSIFEVEVKEPGSHTFQVAMIPNISAQNPISSGWGGGLRKIVLCGFDEMYQDCPECDCPDPDDIIDDWTDDLGIDREDLEDNVNCIFPAIGDIKATLGNPGRGWLLCDGTAYSKGQYPELAALLAGLTPSDDESFNVPDLAGRLLMGSSPDLQLQPGGTDGSLDVTLTTDNLPAHSHTVPAHTHTTQPHNHISPAHVHAANSHTHTSVGHSHTATQVPHTHEVDVRGSATGFGTGAIAASSQTPTGSRTTTAAQPSISVGTTSVEINPATASVQPGTAMINDSNVTVNDAPAAETGETGGGEPVLVIPPVFGVLWFIYAGCKESC